MAAVVVGETTYRKDGTMFSKGCYPTSQMAQCPSGWESLGIWHTHPNGNGTLSGSDLAIANTEKVPIYATDRTGTYMSNPGRSIAPIDLRKPFKPDHWVW